MQKESVKFQDSLCFEGMTSIRAIIEGIDSGVNDRRISTILFDKDKLAKNAKTIGYLKAVSDKYGYAIQESTAVELDKITLGNSHGGLVALCEERTLPYLTANNFDQLIDKNARADAVTVDIILRIPKEKSRLRLDNVRIDGEALVKARDILKRTERIFRAADVHMLEHTRDMIRKIEIIFAVILNHAWCPIFVSARHLQNNALVFPFSRQRVGAVGVNAVNARIVNIEFSVVIAEDERIGLGLALYVEMQFHKASPFCGVFVFILP